MTPTNFERLWRGLTGAGWKGGKAARMAVYAEALKEFDDYVIEKVVKREIISVPAREWFPSASELYQACKERLNNTSKVGHGIKPPHDKCNVCDGTGWMGDGPVDRCDCTRG